MKIYNAEIYTMTDDIGIINNGWIEFVDNKIIAVEKGYPSEICDEDIDALGGIILPGFIDAHSHLGIIENGLDFEGDDCNESSDPFTPQLRAIDGINPFDFCFEEARKRGITTAVSAPGSANACGGQIAFIKTAGKMVDKMAIPNLNAIKFALGENPKNVYSDKGEAPITRMAITALIREGLHKAKRYMNEYNEYLEDKENLDPPEYDIKCEALMPLLNKTAKAHFHCHRADDICTAIRISKEFDLDIVIVHGTEAYLIADILAEENIPVICGPVICDRCKPEMKGLDIKNTAELNKNKVKTAICTDHTVIPIQYLPLSAQVAQKGGLDFINALKNITCNSAEIIGAENIGILKPNMDADIQLYAKGDNPLDLMSEPKIVFINGVRI